MDVLIKKYEEKMERAGFAEKGSVLVILRGQPFAANIHSELTRDLEKVSVQVDRNVLLYVEPAEPYKTIIDYLAAESGSVICPQDFENRLLLHDLPIIDGFHHEAASAALKQRRGVIIRNRGIVTTADNLEQAFVTISSVCFSCFVKLYTDYLIHTRQGTVDAERKDTFVRVTDRLEDIPDFEEQLIKGPLTGEQTILSAMAEAGKLTVDSHLVDANFGNISYRFEDTLYISRTGSSLDELQKGIVAVSLRPGAPVPQTVSSEFPAHRQILTTTGNRAVLHGHPKFSVILSLACDRRPQCEYQGVCQTECPYERYVAGVPVVPGEGGDGPYGLSHTVPPAMQKGHTAVIVYGHGLFSAGRLDYNEAFRYLLHTEKTCRRLFFNAL